MQSYLMKRLVLSLVVLVAWPGCVSAQPAQPAQDAAYIDVPAPLESGPAQGYASVPGVVSLFSRDAIGQFKYFFAAAPVVVEPFIVIDEFSSSKKMTTLGITLADQMAAVINNEAVAPGKGAGGGAPQRIWGFLQEAGGYLRVHVTGENSRGEHRSYVVNVQMSEPIYRALHTYVSLQ